MSETEETESTQNEETAQPEATESQDTDTADVSEQIKHAFDQDDEEMLDDDEEEEEEEEEEVPFVSIFDILDAPRILPDPIDLTINEVTQIQKDLGVVKLCWPEIREPSFENRHEFPDSYLKNTDKEKLLLLYAESFRRQFHGKFPHRKPLFLAAQNECGLTKMVCTTLRPTTTQHQEIQDWNTCAKFISDLIDLEPIDAPTILPDHLYSPNALFQRLKGSSFEIANALCSLLLGLGYDAYLVSGYGTLDLTEKNMIRTDSPFPVQDEDNEEVEEEVKEAKYALNPPRDLRSKFILMMEQREIDKINEEKEMQAEELRKIQEEIERPPYDPLDGQRKHAWVMVHAGRRQIEEHFFIEASTGTKYGLDCPFYSAIESIWNDVNYWVNLQDCSEGLGSINYDLSNVVFWEHLLVGEPLKYRKTETSEDMDEDEIQNLITMDEKHLDMPYYWSERIHITHQLLANRYPGGVKKEWYKRTLVEQFAEYVQEDGLVARVSRFHDFDCSLGELYAIEERFENRQDYMTKVIYNVETREITEYFKRGREDAAKKHKYYRETRSSPESDRLIEFYQEARYDGLSKADLTATSMTEYYSNREDKINYKSTTYCERGKAPPGFVESHRRIVAKIVEKYDRDESVTASKDLAFREFCIVENEIHLKFHYDRGCVTATTRNFIKPPISEMGENLTFNPDRTSGYVSEIGGKPPSGLYLFNLLAAQLTEEEQSTYRVRDMEDQVIEFVRLRDIERAQPNLVVSLFNREHNVKNMEGMKKKEQEEKAHKEREVDEDIDYLAPYTARLGLPAKRRFSYSQARKIKAEFLEMFKQMLVNRANDIQREFEKTTQDLVEKQAWYTSVQDTLRFDEEETYFREVRDTSFYLHTLELRLARHRDLAAIRYAQMVSYITSDPRMVSLTR